MRDLTATTVARMCAADRCQLLPLRRSITPVHRGFRSDLSEITRMSLVVGHALVAFSVAFIAGAINAVAGGGSLVSFPALIWLGLPSVIANATNTTATWPGSMASAWGYRRELRGTDPRVFALVAPSLAGGMIGALLLRLTPTPLFDRLVPILVLFATCLFMAQDQMQRRFTNGLRQDHSGSKWLAGATAFQLHGSRAHVQGLIRPQGIEASGIRAVQV